MGFIEKVKSIVSEMRKQGKTEQEVEAIVKEAADKATFTKKADMEERGTDANGNLEQAINKGSINEALMAIRKIKEIHEERKSEEKRNTNNWRKMHGLTMRRRCKRRKKAWMKKKR